MDHEVLHKRTRDKGANTLVYWLVRAILQPFFHIYVRLGRIGREHIPAEGPAILASNQSQLPGPVRDRDDGAPAHVLRREEGAVRSMALGVMLSVLGAFPVDRGASDVEMIETARALLARGEIVLMFPEGTRTRPGPLGHPKRGIGRLALETGAPVVPVAVIGTDAVRRAGVEVDLGCRTPEQATEIAGARVNRPYLPGVELPASVPVLRAAEMELGGAGAICLAVPARSLPNLLAAHGERIQRDSGLLMLSRGAVATLGALPSAFAAQRSGAGAVAVLSGPERRTDVLGKGAWVVLASSDRAFLRQLADVLAGAGLGVSITNDVAGVELADVQGMPQCRRRPQRRPRRRAWPRMQRAKWLPRFVRWRARSVVAQGEATKAIAPCASRIARGTL